MELIFIRTIILFILSFVILRLMGKRQFGELEPYEVVITIMIAEVAMTPMDDPKVSLFYGVIPIITLYILHTAISFLTLKFPLFRTVMCGKETVIIDNGRILIENMRRNDYSMDELTEQLREKGIFNINEVNYAIIEAGGTLSVMKKSEYSHVSKGDLNIKTPSQKLPTVIITCGKYENPCTFNKKLFEKIVAKNGFGSIENVFYAALSGDNKLFIQDYGKKQLIMNLGDTNDA